MYIEQLKNDDEPTVLKKQEDQWVLVEQVWNLIPIKYYQVNVICGQPCNKRLLYQNLGNQSISYLIQTNKPKIVKIKNTAILLTKDEGVYIKFSITPPNTPCQFTVKFVIYDVKKGIPIEGIDLDVIVR